MRTLLSALALASILFVACDTKDDDNPIIPPNDSKDSTRIMSANETVTATTTKVKVTSDQKWTIYDGLIPRSYNTHDVTITASAFTAGTIVVSYLRNDTTVFTHTVTTDTTTWLKAAQVVSKFTNVRFNATNATGVVTAKCVGK